MTGKLEKHIKYYGNGQKKCETYTKNNKFHREDGPAVIWWYENGQKQYEEYWIYNYVLTLRQFCQYRMKRKWNKIMNT